MIKTKPQNKVATSPASPGTPLADQKERGTARQLRFRCFLKVRVCRKADVSGHRNRARDWFPEIVEKCPIDIGGRSRAAWDYDHCWHYLWPGVR